MRRTSRASSQLPLASPQSLSGAEWVARVRAGDIALFEQTFRVFLPRLVIYLSRFVATRAAAEDIVHDLFLALWRTRDTLEIRESMTTYLYAAARHRALDVLKHERVVQRWAERNGQPEADPGPSPERVAAQSELAAAVASAVSALPPRGRAIFDMKQQGLTHREIATALGVSVKTVETHIWRAVRALRVRLRPFRD